MSSKTKSRRARRSEQRLPPALPEHRPLPNGRAHTIVAARGVRQLYLPAVLLLAAVVAFVYLRTLRPGHTWDDDFALYVSHAINLAEGRPYQDTGYLFNPDYPSYSPRQYPPLYPLVLAPIYLARGLDLEAMKVPAIISFAVALVLVGLIARRELGEGYGMALVALLGAAPYFWYFKNDVVPDLLLLALLYLGLLLSLRAQEGAPSRRGQITLGLAVGAIAFLAYSAKTAGAVLLPSVVVADLWRTRRLSRFSVCVVGSFALLAALASVLLRGAGAAGSAASYTSQLNRSPEALLDLVLYNLRSYPDSFAFLFENGHVEEVSWAAAALFTALVAYGFFLRARRQLTVLEIFFLANLAVILLWPGFHGLRYAIPLLPLYFLYGLHALREATSRLSPQMRTATLLLSATFLAVSYAGQFSVAWPGPIPHAIGSVESMDLFEYVAQGTAPTDVVVFRKPRALSLYTGRQATVWAEGSDEQLWHFLRRARATHIVVGRIFGRDLTILLPFIQRYPEHFERVHANPDFAVFRIISWPAVPEG